MLIWPKPLPRVLRGETLLTHEKLLAVSPQQLGFGDEIQHRIEQRRLVRETILTFAKVHSQTTTGRVLRLSGSSRRAFGNSAAPTASVSTLFCLLMVHVAHKVVPSIASNNRVFKPSEKVPFSAILLADILFEARTHPVWRHQGLRPGLQGRRAGRMARPHTNLRP